MARMAPKEATWLRAPPSAGNLLEAPKQYKGIKYNSGSTSGTINSATINSLDHITIRAALIRFGSIFH
eukprot:CAMPEP_0197455534 /NCGR_PEP_ID=MMETSP1175-20131217/41034_1 /TAXON_ID=1003142 /ORGANISM="Triceratium dubium, Strain CCMP147" /LENGTH=67 /DNA_ID=CAMNT_0042989411 /DNA_START=42 /DNA_END=242 /DNA_ORIENTATION=+